MNLACNERSPLLTCDLKLKQAHAYHKGARAVDEYPGTITELCSADGTAGLGQLSAVGKNLAARIAAWLEQEEIRGHEPGNR